MDEKINKIIELEEKLRKIAKENIKLEQQRDELLQYLELIEAWEADLITCDKCWENGLPQLNRQLYDSWIDLQSRRNSLIEKIEKI